MRRLDSRRVSRILGACPVDGARTPTRPEHDGRYEDVQLLGERGGEQEPASSAPPSHITLTTCRAAKLTKKWHGARSALGCRRNANDANTCGLERFLGRPRRGGGGDDAGRGLVERRDHVAREWQPQLAVHYHSNRVPPGDVAHRESRIVGEHRVDADHHRIVLRTQELNARLESAPVIHLLAPVLVAMRPSSEIASLRVKYAAPSVMNLDQGLMVWSASSSSTPTRTWTPAASSRSMPPPETFGRSDRGSR